MKKRVLSLLMALVLCLSLLPGAALAEETAGAAAPAESGEGKAEDPAGLAPSPWRTPQNTWPKWTASSMRLWRTP